MKHHIAILKDLTIVTRVIRNLIKSKEITRADDNSFKYDNRIFKNIEELKIYLTTCH